MKKIVLSIFLFSSASVTMAGQAVHRNINNFTGTYVLDQGNKAGGTLKVIQLTYKKLKFDLECNRGAPSYNSGETSATIEIGDTTALFQTTEFGGKCTIAFEFQKNGVVISQTGSDADCGFGFGVRCDGKYRLKSRKRPNLSDDR